MQEDFKISKSKIQMQVPDKLQYQTPFSVSSEENVYLQVDKDVLNDFSDTKDVTQWDH